MAPWLGPRGAPRNGVGALANEWDLPSTDPASGYDGPMRLSALALALFLLLPGCRATHQPVLVNPPDMQRAAPPTLFQGVRLYDGIADFLSDPLDLLVVGGRVAAMAPAGVHQAPEGVLVVDGRGKTLLPGLIDVNVRFGDDLPAWAPGPRSPEVEAEALIFAGVTSVISVGHNVNVERLQKQIAAGEVAGPRILRSTRMITAKGSHPVPKGTLPWLIRPFQIDEDVQEVGGTRAAARAARNDLERYRSDFVLVDASSMPPGSPVLKEDAIRAVVAETAMYEKRVFALAARPADAVAAAKAGVAVLLTPPWESVLTDPEAEEIAFSGTGVATTLTLWPSLLDALDGRAPEGSLVERISLRPKGEPPKVDEETRATLRRYADNVRQNILKLREAGAPLLLGTASGLPGVLPGASVQQEVVALAALGIPGWDVLQMATFLPVRVLDPSARFGVITPGAYADLVLVEGDPTEDPAAIGRVVGVWQAGIRLDRREP